MKMQLLGAPVELALVKVGPSYQVIGGLQHGEVVLGHHFVVIEDVPTGAGHVVDVALGVFH